jgi:hypothetical protein
VYVYHLKTSDLKNLPFTFIWFIINRLCGRSMQMVMIVEMSIKKMC